MPTFVLCMSTRARRSLLERLPRKSLTNLFAYFMLSPQPPHCQALRFSRSGASSHVQRSMRPALQALAIAWVSPAEEMAYKKAVSLNPGKDTLHINKWEAGKKEKILVQLQFLHFKHRSVKYKDTSVVFLVVQYLWETKFVLQVQKEKERAYIPLFSMLARWRPSKGQFHLSKRNW